MNAESTSTTAANSLAEETHPFTHCMTVVVPGMKKQPSDPKAFCAYLTHQQTGEWPGEKSSKSANEIAAANAKVFALKSSDGDAALEQFEAANSGSLPGHSFRGNQYTKIAQQSSKDADKSSDEANKGGTFVGHLDAAKSHALAARDHAEAVAQHRSIAAQHNTTNGKDVEIRQDALRKVQEHKQSMFDHIKQAKAHFHHADEMSLT